MRYVYYEPTTKQIMAVFDMPILSSQANWEAKGYTRAIVDEGVIVNRDSKIRDTATGPDGEIVTSVDRSINPLQPAKQSRARRAELQERLRADTITATEIREMLRLERGLGTP